MVTISVTGFPPRIKYGVTFFRGNDGDGAIASTVSREARAKFPGKAKFPVAGPLTTARRRRRIPIIMNPAGRHKIFGYYRPFFTYAYRRAVSVNPACEAR